ncbi:hypothetical protein [Mycoplasma sp. HS2188]|uniref:hypothetical protein n=1 Tax=Mycoplasma sp. HS2188 TaxID=2976765 RepID=UPI0021AA9A50|nr:hypothetical protein [Mycoplasma sp. HS2188]MCT4469487.1 hypothetical protein [Mycoplasma sp. HS2188]
MNEKFKIYIDFEAITYNYLVRVIRNIPRYQELPYIFTLGLYKDNRFITITNKIDLSLITDDKSLNFAININLKELIIEAVQKLTKIKDLEINDDTVEFIAWGVSLENKILTQLFGMRATNLQGNYEFSLDHFIPTGVFCDSEFDYINFPGYSQYFYENKKLKIKPDFAKGALASIIGALVLASSSQSNIVNTRLKFPLPEKLISIALNSIYEYNKQDVLKMFFILQNSEKSNNIHTKIIKYNKEKNKINSEINTLEKIIKLLSKTIEGPDIFDVGNIRDDFKTIKYLINTNNIKINENSQLFIEKINKLESILDFDFRGVETIINELKTIANKLEKKFNHLKHYVIPGLADNEYK